MLSIVAKNIGKKYVNEWIFKNLDISIFRNDPIAIIGPNGSGKSTLMQSLANIIPINEGIISYDLNGTAIEQEDVFSKISYAAPYLDLIEEFTLEEAVIFHQKFRPFENNMNHFDFIELTNLKKNKSKQIKYFSSGMKQRLKLSFAFFSESEFLFLDEPTANLDYEGFKWYESLVLQQLEKKIVIISSNEPKEYSFCKNQINIINFKK